MERAATLLTVCCLPGTKPSRSCLCRPPTYAFYFELIRPPCFGFFHSLAVLRSGLSVLSYSLSCSSPRFVFSRWLSSDSQVWLRTVPVELQLDVDVLRRCGVCSLRYRLAYLCGFLWVYVLKERGSREEWYPIFSSCSVYRRSHLTSVARTVSLEAKRVFKNAGTVFFPSVSFSLFFSLVFCPLVCGQSVTSCSPFL